MKQSVLVVDDEVSIVTLLTFNLNKAGFLTDVAYDGKEAIKKSMQNRYDMIILDVMLPEISGMDVCKKLRKSRIETPIIMLTAKGEESDKISGLELGADDYLTKPFSPKEIIARINAVLRRAKRTSANNRLTLKIGDLTLNAARYTAELNEKIVTFTKREFELLFYFAAHLNDVLSRDTLLKEVWGYDFAGDTRIVDVHVSRLREKIEPNVRNPDYIKTIRGLGYKMEDPLI